MQKIAILTPVKSQITDIMVKDHVAEARLDAFANGIDTRKMLLSYDLIPLDTARNELVKDFLSIWKDDSEVTHAFLLDSDMVIPFNTITQLLSVKEDVVSGLYVARTYPHYPNMFVKSQKGNDFEPIMDFSNTGLIKADRVGIGCLLVTRKVLETLQFPYFRFVEYGKQGEDFYFCEKVQKAGFTIWVNLDVWCDQILRTKVGVKHFLTAKKYIK